MSTCRHVRRVRTEESVTRMSYICGNCKTVFSEPNYELLSKMNQQTQQAPAQADQATDEQAAQEEALSISRRFLPKAQCRASGKTGHPRRS